MVLASNKLALTPPLPATAVTAALKSEMVDDSCVPVWFALASGSVASLDRAMPAVADTSALTMVPSKILADVTAPSTILAVVTEPSSGTPPPPPVPPVTKLVWPSMSDLVMGTPPRT